jgi:hypothetical protein
MWIHHYTPESRQQNMECKHLTSSVEKEVQNSTIGGKSVVGTFLGCTRATFGTLPRGAQQ